ncbi:MAG TPA: hypothetical protein VJA27_04085 [Patescibacteria group bacterium]|nr:hypothetical protein [Patescibacteria group bacterium]
MDLSKVVVRVVSCTDPTCDGQKGPDGKHSHTVTDISKTGAYVSRRAALAWPDAFEEVTWDLSPERRSDVLTLVNLHRAAIGSADLPETADGDDEYIRRVFQTHRSERHAARELQREKNELIENGIRHLAGDVPFAIFID